MQKIKYKDFEKYDTRRCLVTLFAVERMAERATAHYIASEIDCTRAEVARSLATAQKQFLMVIEKTGPVYKIKSWGILNRKVALTAISSDIDT